MHIISIYIPLARTWSSVAPDAKVTRKCNLHSRNPKAQLKLVGYLLVFLIFYLFIYIERGREGEREGEKHQCVVASLLPPTGDLATTQVCALTGNRPSKPLVHRPTLNPLSHTSQGSLLFIQVE